MTNGEDQNTEVLFEMALNGDAFHACEAMYLLFENNGHNKDDGIFLVIQKSAKNFYAQKTAEEIINGQEPGYFDMRARNASHLKA